jgi:hypothetical protein
VIGWFATEVVYTGKLVVLPVDCTDIGMRREPANHSSTVGDAEVFTQYDYYMVTIGRTVADVSPISPKNMVIWTQMSSFVREREQGSNTYRAYQTVKEYTVAAVNLRANQKKLPYST